MKIQLLPGSWNKLLTTVKLCFKYCYICYVTAMLKPLIYKQGMFFHVYFSRFKGGSISLILLHNVNKASWSYYTQGLKEGLIMQVQYLFHLTYKKVASTQRRIQDFP